MNHYAKKWICTNLPLANMSQKMQKRRKKSGAKMINGTFAYQNHRIVNNEANVECAIFSPIAPKFS